MRGAILCLLCAVAVADTEEEIEELKSVLRDPLAGTRNKVRAARRLGALGPAAESALIGLTDALEEDGVRPAARDALIAIGPVAVPGVVMCLWGHSAQPPGPEYNKGEVVRAYVEILRRHAAALTPRDYKMLGKALVNVPARCDRIVDLLVERGSDGVAPLVDALKKGRAEVQAWAARGLARLGEEGRASVLGLARSRNRKTRSTGALALSVFPAEIAIPRLRELMQDDADAVQLHAAAALKRHAGKHPEAVQILLAAGSDTVDLASIRATIRRGILNLPMRRLALDVETDLGDEIVWQVLKRKELAAMVVVALSDAPRASLIAALGGEHADTAAAALALQPEASVPALRAALEDEDAAVRNGAVRTLEAIGAAAAPALPDLERLGSEAALAAHDRIAKLAELARSDCKQALEDYDAKRYEPAAEYFSKAAAAGNPIALHYLSLLLDKGHGIRRDSNRAARLLSEAAWAGYLPSQLLLGEREYPSSDAMHWYKTAAEQGDKKAQFRYADSFVVACQAPRRETYPVVAKYMLASAEQGYAPAQLELYYMYRLGWGVQKDDAAAERWLDKAAYQGYPEALAKKYNSIKLDSDKRVEAYAWFLVADERGVGKTDDGRRMRRELSSAQRKEAKQRAAELSRKIPEWND